MEENKNITIILNFYRLFESPKSTKEFNSETIYHASSKLQMHNQHELLHRQCKTTSQFVNKLGNIRKLDYEIMHLKPIVSANGPPRYPRNRPRFGLNKLSAKAMKCHVCEKTDRREVSCPSLLNTNVSAVKSLLNNKKLCHICLKRVDGSRSH